MQTYLLWLLCPPFQLLPRVPIYSTSPIDLFPVLKELTRPISFISCWFHHYVNNTSLLLLYVYRLPKSLERLCVAADILIEWQLETAELKCLMKLRHQIRRKNIIHIEISLGRGSHRGILVISWFLVSVNVNLGNYSAWLVNWRFCATIKFSTWDPSCVIGSLHHYTYRLLILYGTLYGN